MRIKLVLLAIVFALGAAAVFSAPRETTVAGYATSLKERSRSQRHNAVLALERLVGATIAPHETFSFNARVGSFSRDQGYRKAPVSYNGQLIDDWGGGVCQTSTTLYNAALLAGLEIVERHRHRFAPSYIPPGRDAAVAFSNIDLRFRNPHPFPVRIEGRVEGERLFIYLVGPKPLSHRPEVVSEVHEVQDPSTFQIGSGDGPVRVRNTGKQGCEVAVIRIDGLRRELISRDTYPAMNRVVER